MDSKVPSKVESTCTTHSSSSGSSSSASSSSSLPTPVPVSGPFYRVGARRVDALGREKEPFHVCLSREEVKIYTQLSYPVASFYLATFKLKDKTQPLQLLLLGDELLAWLESKYGKDVKMCKRPSQKSREVYQDKSWTKAIAIFEEAKAPCVAEMHAQREKLYWAAPEQRENRYLAFLELVNASQAQLSWAQNRRVGHLIENPDGYGLLAKLEISYPTLASEETSSPSPVVGLAENMRTLAANRSLRTTLHDLAIGQELWEILGPIAENIDGVLLAPFSGDDAEAILWPRAHLKLAASSRPIMTGKTGKTGAE